MKSKYKIRVNYDLDNEYGFFSIYEVDATDHHEAERKAIQKFIDDFCGGIKPKPGVISYFTFNKELTDYRN